jgi:hypothetical protein
MTFLVQTIRTCILHLMGFSVAILLHRLYHVHNCISAGFDFIMIFRYRRAVLIFSMKKLVSSVYSNVLH